MNELKSKGKNENIDKLSLILEQNFKKNIKDYVKSIFNKYKIEKNMVIKEYREKFLSKEY